MRVSLLVLAVFACTPARAQVETVVAGDVCRLPADAPETMPAPARRGASPRVEEPAEACAPERRTARFEVEYVGFPDDARAAFQAAVDVWACRVVSLVPVRVTARWEPLDATTLGTAAPVLFRNFDGAPVRDTFFAAALANAIAGRDLNTDQPDVQARFNSTFPSWHLDPAAPPPADRYDLTTVVLHELAHGLGFIGALTVESGLGYVGSPGGTRGPYAYDRFTEDASGTPLLDARVYPDASVALSGALRSGAVFFDSPGVRQAAGARAPLHAPPAWTDGGSYSHLDERSFAAESPDGLMTPFLARGERIAEPGETVCAVLASMGWSLAGDCAARVGPLPPPAAALTVRRTGPNPFARRTGLRIETGVPGPVRATLFDASGRRVAVLADGSVGDGEAFDLIVSAAGLASGAYFVHIAAGDVEQVVALTVVR